MILKAQTKKANATEEEKQTQNASPDPPKQTGLGPNIPHWIIPAASSQKLKRESCVSLFRFEFASLARTVPMHNHSENHTLIAAETCCERVVGDGETWERRRARGLADQAKFQQTSPSAAFARSGCNLIFKRSWNHCCFRSSGEGWDFFFVGDSALFSTSRSPLKYRPGQSQKRDGTFEIGELAFPQCCAI